MPPPRWTWKPSTCSPSSSMTSWPLRPMSATWVRAQALGQPLTLTRDRGVEVGEAPLELGDQVAGAVLGVDDGELAELDAGAGHRVAAPVRRPGREADRVERRRRSASTRSASTPISTIFWYGVSRAPATPYCSTRSASAVSERAGDPADGRRDADVELAVLLLVHADVVALCCGEPGDGAVGQLAARGTRSRGPRGTSRRPSRRPGTSAGRASAAGGSRSRGRSRPRPPRRRRPRRAGSRRPASGRASGWWTGRRRPTGRSRGRARGARCRRTRRR